MLRMRVWEYEEDKRLLLAEQEAHPDPSGLENSSLMKRCICKAYSLLQNPDFYCEKSVVALWKRFIDPAHQDQECLQDRSCGLPVGRSSSLDASRAR